MLETLLFDYCKQNGLEETEEPPKASSTQKEEATE